MKLLSLTQGPQKHIYLLNNQYSLCHFHICNVSFECLAPSSTNTDFVSCLFSGTSIMPTAFYRLRQEKGLPSLIQTVDNIQEHLYIINPLATKNVAEVLK